MSNSEESDINYIRLLEALKRGQKWKACQLILNNNEIHLNRKLSSDSLLHWAVVNFRDTKIIELLLAKKVDINTCFYTEQRRSETSACFYIEQRCLDIAVHHGKTNIVQFLIERDAHIAENLESLLCHATSNGYEIIVQLLIDYGMRNNLLVNFKTVLNRAIEKGYPKLIERIIPLCTFENATDKQIPMHILFKIGKSFNDSVNILLKWGFSVNPCTNDEKFIYSAVENGCTCIVKNLVELGIDVNMKNKQTGLTLLHVACFYKHLEIVQILVNHKADVNIIIPEIKWSRSEQSYLKDIKRFVGKTCLHIAVDHFDTNLIKLLLDYGQKVNNDPIFFTVARIAVENDDKEMFKMLDNYEIDINAVDVNKRTLLHFFAYRNYRTSGCDCNNKYEIAELLLKKGANVNAQDKKGETPLMNTIRYGSHGCFEYAEFLLKYKANINSRDNEGMTLLHLECGLAVVESVQFLLDHGAEVNALNNYGQTPIHIVCGRNVSHVSKILKIFSQYNTDFDVADLEGQTPLFKACEAVNFYAIEFLLKKNSNVNHVDLQGNTPLFIAVKSYHYHAWKILDMFLEAKANIHLVNYQGETLLHIVAKENCPMRVQKLVKLDINVNSVDKEGRTALHLAVEKGHVAAVNKLIKYGADINISSINYQTAFQIAVQRILDCHTATERSHKHRIRFYQKILQILKRHIIKLKCAELFVNKQNIDLIYDSYKPNDNFSGFSNYNNYIDDSDNEDYYDYYSLDSDYSIGFLERAFKAEIEKLKMKKIEGTNITYYDLLTQCNKTITRYVKMNNIMPQLDKDTLDDLFPHYTNIIWNRVVKIAKIVERTELLDIAQEYSLPGIYCYLPDICKDRVFSYFNSDDLRIFIEVMKTFKCSHTVSF